MAGGLQLYLFVVAAVFVGVLAAMIYYDRSASTRAVRRKYGLSATGMAWAIGLCTLFIAGMVVLGNMPFPDTPGFTGRFEARRIGFALVFNALPLYLGVLALAAARGNLPTYRRLRQTTPTPAGEITGGVSAVSGIAEPHEGTVETPFTGEEALCYRWRVEAYDPHGIEGISQTSNLWEPTHLGTGGVVFAVTDESGSVLVDPEGAEFSLPAERRRDFDNEASVPAEIRSELDSQLSGTQFRFIESYLRPGTEVSVLGTAADRESGAVLTDGGETPFVISHGQPDSLLARYRRRTLGFLLAGAVLVPFGLWLLLGFFGVR